MIALFDANISWRLKELLKDYFTKCLHVDSCGLNAPAADLDIWKFAELKKCPHIYERSGFYQTFQYLWISS